MVDAILRRLPLYATGILLAAAFSAVARARGWSEGEALVYGGAMLAAYLLLVLVPWLVREHGHPKHGATKPEMQVRPLNGSSFVAVRTTRNTFAGPSVEPKPLELVH